MDYVKASYEVIMYGESKSGVILEHEVEAFVVHTFARYMSNPRIPTDAIAIQLMSSLNETGENRRQHLQKVAEECILIDGLGLNHRKWPSETYFVDMAKIALGYRAYAQRPPELFYETVANNMNKISTVLCKVRNQI